MQKAWRLSLTKLLIFTLLVSFSWASIAMNRVSAADALPQVISRNWNQWSKGQLTIDYHGLIADLSNPAIKGEDAAALAALARYMRKHNPTGAMSRADVDSMTEINTITQKQYEAFIQSLATMNRLLYAKGKPNFDVLQQGQIGDCFFFSGIGWLAYYRPQVIVDAIIPLDNGQYRVHFPNGMKVTVDTPTDAELLFFNSASTLTDGLWVTLLEKAVGEVLPHYTSRVVNNAEPAYNLAMGGAPATIERIWTGSEPTVIYLDKNPNRARVREALIAVQQKRLMSQALTPAKSSAHSIAGHHVYAILDFDKSTDVITIWNPWGDEYFPQGPAGIQNGYARKHGIFHMPLDDFMQVYWVLSID